MGRARPAVVALIVASARPILTVTAKVAPLRRPLVLGLSGALRATREYRKGTALTGWLVRRRADLSPVELIGLARFLIDAGAWSDVADVAGELVRRGGPLSENPSLDIAAVLLGLGEQSAAGDVLALGTPPTRMDDPATVRLLVRRIELTRLADQDLSAGDGPVIRLRPAPVSPNTGTPALDENLAGRFAIEPHHLGLRISGWVDNRGSPCTVEIVERDRTFARVQTDARAGVAASRFRLIIRWRSLASLSSLSRLGVLSDGRPLIQTAGGHDWTIEQIRRPAVDRLGDEQLTKKGTVTGRLGGPEGDVAVWAAVRSCVAALDRTGRSAFLLYGTLLGAVRDGRTVTGDDDIDLAFISAATDAEGLRQELLDLTLDLLHQGLTVVLKEAHGWAALEVQMGSVPIDVTAILIQHHKAWAYRRVTADRDAYLPPFDLMVQGVPVTVPADPVAVLTSIYGLGWRTPDAGFQHYPTRSEVRQLRRRAFTGAQVLLLFAAAEDAPGELIAPRHAREVLTWLHRLSAANRLPTPGRSPTPVRKLG